MNPRDRSSGKSTFHARWLNPFPAGEPDLEKGCVVDEKPSSGHSSVASTITPQYNEVRVPDHVFQNPDTRHGSVVSTVSTIAGMELFPTHEADMPPQKYSSSWLRELRWKVLSVYRRLNILVILFNLIVIIVFAAKNKIRTMTPDTASTAVAANITLCVLIRQELVVNMLFVIFGCCPLWVPLRIRRLFAKIYHLGGVHSGAGMAALIWFIVFNVVIFRALWHENFEGMDAAITAITALLDLILLAVCVFSHPKFRSSWHNTWEAIHRFGGWSAVIIFWVHFGILTSVSRRINHPSWSIGETLAKSPVFWMLLVITITIILPWLRLRKVPVQAEKLSNHAVRLHFTYTNLPLCAAPRLSDAPLKEWHSFAGIPSDDGKGFSVLVSKAGDWTAKMIKNPPTHIWVRGLPVRGVLHIAPIFKRIVLVGTGSGIGPVLSLLCARKTDCRILWSTKEPEKTYQKEIIARVREADPDAVILNTTTSGRPDLIYEAKQLYDASNAEAVFVISNPKASYDTVYALESRGIPAFAPIFDS